jgi:hypothetical protein
MLGQFSAALTEHLVAKYTEQLSEIVVVCMRRVKEKKFTNALCLFG